MIALILSLLYVACIGIIDYQVIFVFFSGCRLILTSKLLLFYLSLTALGILVGVIGLGKGKRWAKELILVISSLNLACSLYGLYQGVIVEAIKCYQYNRTFGQAPGSLISLVIFVAFNLYFFRLARKRERA